MRHYETSINIRRHSETSGDLMRHHDTPWDIKRQHDIMRHQQTSRDIMRHHETRWVIMTIIHVCDDIKTSPAITRHDETSWLNDETSQHVTRHHESSWDITCDNIMQRLHVEVSGDIMDQPLQHWSSCMRRGSRSASYMPRGVTQMPCSWCWVAMSRGARRISRFVEPYMYCRARAFS